MDDTNRKMDWGGEDKRKNWNQYEVNENYKLFKYIYDNDTYHKCTYHN
jgi:hypothetical protein